jgi:hypothetical protein
MRCVDDVQQVVVVVPARDEQDRLGTCVRSLVEAAAQVEVPVTLVVALDRCVDGSRGVAELALHGAPAHVRGAVVDVPRVVGRAGTVARVRNVGVRHGLHLAGSTDLAGTWLLHTDADSVVPRRWIARQLRWASMGVDAVVGLVQLDDDPDLPASARDRHDAVVADGSPPGQPHGHVYGANLGVRATAFARVGGFPAVPVGEDRGLVERLDADPAAFVIRTRTGVVTTSGRRVGRADGGLASLLDSFSRNGRGPSLSSAGLPDVQPEVLLDVVDGAR